MVGKLLESCLRLFWNMSGVRIIERVSKVSCLLLSS